MLLENPKDWTLDTLDQKGKIIWNDKVLAIGPNNVSASNNKAFALANLDKNEEVLPLIQIFLCDDICSYPSQCIINSFTILFEIFKGRRDIDFKLLQLTNLFIHYIDLFIIF